MNIFQKIFNSIKIWVDEYIKLYQLYEKADKSGLDICSLIINDRGEYLAFIKPRKKDFRTQSSSALILANAERSLSQYNYGVGTWVYIK